MIQIQTTSNPDENDTIINIDKPRYNQSTYLGRFKHFALLTNPLNLLATNKQLENAYSIIESYRKTKILPKDMTIDELWKAKYLVDSAYHPCTKEKMFILGN
jgi:sideroflexin-1/3